MHDEEDAMSQVTVGLWVPLQAKEGKEAEVEEFLKAGQALVEEEPGTIAWFAVKMGPGRYGIFDVFADDADASSKMRMTACRRHGYRQPAITRYRTRMS